MSSKKEYPAIHIRTGEEQKVRLGAIIVVAARNEAFALSGTPGECAGAPHEGLFAGPISRVEILGRSMLDRMIERFLLAHVEVVSVITDSQWRSETPQALNYSSDQIEVQVVDNLPAAISLKVQDYAASGIEHAFVSSANTYTETDLLDLFYFHREARQAATRAFDARGSLNIWIVDCAQAQDIALESLLSQAEHTGASYFIREYTCRVTNPRDLRRLVADGLRGSCALQPVGEQIRLGIWIGAGAEIHRRARIVAPAYIGCGSRVREDSLITRCSNIERDCFVDYATAVEDSSVLANTRIGIGLEVCHAVIREDTFFSLDRNVTLKISDPRLVRANGTVAKEEWSPSTPAEEIESPARVEDLERSTPAAWQLGANLT